MKNPLKFPRWSRTSLAVAVVAPLIIIIWHIGIQVAGPNGWHERQVIDELGSSLRFEGDPIPNHAGTKLLFARSSEHGFGIYLADLTTRQRRLLFEQEEKYFSPGDYRPLGWSPDDGLLAFVCRTARDKRLVICDGNTGVELQFVKFQGIGAMTWVTPQSLVYYESRDKTLREVRQVHGKWQSSAGFKMFNRKNHYELPAGNLTGLAPFTGDSVMWQIGNTVWRGNLNSSAPTKVVELPGINNPGTLVYSDARRQFLSLEPLASGVALIGYDFSTGIPVKLDEIKNFHSPRNLMLLNGGTGYAFDGRSRERPDDEALMVKTNLTAPPAVSYWKFSIKANAANESQICLVGAQAEEPSAIWKFDSADGSLARLISNQERPFQYSRFIEPVRFTTTNQGGTTLSCVLFPPAHCLPSKKYPLVISVSRSEFEQTIANSGAYCACVDRPFHLADRAGEFFEIQSALSDHPNIDLNRVYIIGESREVGEICQALAENPQKWHGAMLLGPAGNIPDLSRIGHPRLLIDCGDADEYMNKDAWQRLWQFQDAALMAGLPVSIGIHPDAEHTYRSLASQRGRIKQIADFLSE